MCPQNEKCNDPVCCEWICLSIYQAEEEGYKVVTTKRFLYLPLLRGLMFETDNVAWCDAAIKLLQE